MDTKTTPDSKLYGARRKLLRGSFSLPAVLAVHNGSALATNSNQFRCMINATTKPGMAVYPSPVIDATLTREKGWVPVYKATTVADGTKYYIQVSDLSYVGSLLGGFVGPGNTPATGWIAYGAGAAYSYVTPIATPSATNTRAAVMLKTFGSTVKVVDYNRPSQAAISGQSGALASCWSSVKP